MNPARSLPSFLPPPSRSEAFFDTRVHSIRLAFCGPASCVLFDFLPLPFLSYCYVVPFSAWSLCPAIRHVSHVHLVVCPALLCSFWPMLFLFPSFFIPTFLAPVSLSSPCFRSRSFVCFSPPCLVVRKRMAKSCWHALFMFYVLCAV